MICGDALVKVRDTGGDNIKFKDETRKLLTIDGEPLFDAFTDEFWEVFTQGRAKAQLVFVPVP